MRCRLVTKAVTLDDLEQQNKGFINFRFCDFGLWLLLQEWIAPISLELNQNNLHMKFLVLNVDFNSPSLEPLFKETSARGYSPDTHVGQFFCFLCPAFFTFFLTFFVRIFRRFAHFFTQFKLPESGGIFQFNSFCRFVHASAGFLVCNPQAFMWWDSLFVTTDYIFERATAVISSR